MIADNLAKLKSQIPENVKLIAVSKTHPADAILEAYKVGQRNFGENKVQEMQAKQALLPKDIVWHLIGHLQTNKVKNIAPFVSYIHAVDSLKLLIEIDKRAAQNNRVINCFLQMYIAKEETKFGLNEEELFQLLNAKDYAEMQHIKICGLMGMATYTDNQSQINDEFSQLYKLFNIIKQEYFLNKSYFCDLSMGMSGDYEIAIKNGSTMVRIGSAIFGNRNYN
jgi:pyridoxal phosphate enzyme (YggS family)